MHVRRRRLAAAGVAGVVFACSDTPGPVAPPTPLALSPAVSLPWDESRPLVVEGTTPPGRLRWSSSDSAVVHVDSSGVVTARRRGQALVTARDGDRSASTVVTVDGRYTAIAASRAHTCAIAAGGRTACWGDNELGAALGAGNAPSYDQRLPVPTSTSARFVAITAARGHQSFASGAACALTATGEGYCWGGRGPSAPGTTAVPTPVSGGTFSFASVAAGAQHICALTAAGEPYCWGSAASGALGTPASTADRPTPAPVPTTLRFRSMALGESFTCGVTPAGEGHCWGANPRGQLGSTAATGPTPARIAGGHAFASIAAGRAHACGVTTAGAALCWGYNWRGAIGNGVADDASYTAPVAVQGGLTFASLSATDWSTCGITTEGAVYCWGLNADGQLGDGTALDSPTPRRVLLGEPATAISGGMRHACAITISRAAYCWGANFGGQLGNGLQVASSVPVRVGAPQ